MSQYLSFDTTTAEGFAPIKPPSQKLAAVKTVQTIDGYVGQAIYEGQIVWQSERTYKTAAKALRVAEAHVTDRVASLLA